MTSDVECTHAAACNRPSGSWRGKLKGLFFKYWGCACAATILLAYSFFLRHYFVPATLHPDANGYWAQGSLFMSTGRTWFKPQSSAQYIGMHWLITPDDAYISRYPPGLPVVTGLVWKTLGWRASMLVNPVLAVLSLLAVFMIVGSLSNDGWGLFAMLALALNPTFTVHALTNIAHMPVAFCLAWGFFLLLKWSLSGRLAHAFAAGLVLGCIPTIRYADSIVALGVAAFLLLHLRRFPRIYVHYAVAVAGALIPIVPLLVRNHLVLGAFWRTGYALTNEQTGFGWDFFSQNYLGYLDSLQGRGLGMLFALGLVGMLMMVAGKRRRPEGLFLLLSSLPLLVVYMSYYWARGINATGPGGGGVGSMRFLVPMIPVYVIAAAWMLSEILHSTPRAGRVAIPLSILMIQGMLSMPYLRRELQEQHDRKIPLLLATEGLEEVARKGDLVIAGNGLLQHLDCVREWKLADPSVIGGERGGRPGVRGAGVGASRRDPDAPSPMQAEKRESRAKLYEGTSQDKGSQFLDDIELWAGKKDIYVVGGKDELDRLLPGVEQSSLVVVKRIPTPKPPPASEAQDPRARMDRVNPRGGTPSNVSDRRRREGGIFRSFVSPGEDIIIARWE